MKITKLFLLTAVLFLISKTSVAQENKYIDQLNHILEEKTKIIDQQSNLLTENNKRQSGVEYKFTSNTPGGEAETFIAINPTNSNNLVASFMKSQNTISFPIYFTNNGGTSWTKSTFDVNALLLSDYPGQIVAGGGDPVFGFDDNGKCFFSWIYLSIQNGQYDTAFMNMFWASSIDGGQNWSVQSNYKIGGGAILLNGGGAGGVAEFGEGIFDRQWMDVDRSGGAYNGTVYVSNYFIPHASSTLQNEGMLLNKMNSGSNGFQSVGYAGLGTTQFGNIKVNQLDGSIHITYCNVTSNKLYHTKSTDGGTTFSTPVEIANNGVLMPNNSNLVHSRENAASSLAIDGSGNLHVVWNTFSQGTFNSYYSNSTDGGANWSTPLLIDGLLSNGKSFMPTIAASGNNVSISTYSISGVKQSVYKTISSTNNGMSFSNEQILSGDTTNYQGFSQQAFFGDYDCSVMEGCTLYSTWSDGRGTSPVVYVGKTNACSGIGISEFSPINADLEVGEFFPNPAHNTVNLPIESIESGNFYGKILTLDGKVIHSFKLEFNSDFQNLKIDLPELISGMYMVNLESDKGIQFSRKLVIQ